MIRTLTFFLALLFINNLNGQINDLPKLELPFWYEWRCPLTDDTTQNLKIVKVGNRILKYTSIGDKKLREEFIGENQISKALVLHYLVTDTIPIWDSISNNFIIGYDTYFRDWPVGDYEEYWNDPKGIKCKGTYDKGKSIGEWIFIDANKNKMVVNFNNKGHIDGPYGEYYFHKDSNSYTLKREGQFESKELMIARKSASGKTYDELFVDTRRVGIWKYYSIDQTLLDVANYK